jgi:hypothetical protein
MGQLTVGDFVVMQGHVDLRRSRVDRERDHH